MLSDCIFCKIIRGEAASAAVYQDESVYAFLDINPAAEYHTLVIPKAHYENIFDVPEADLLAVMAAVRKLARLYREKLGIRDVQIINSSGSQAQQDVFHLHFHIVPRRRGDGQDIRWTTHPEWRERFSDFLDLLNVDAFALGGQGAGVPAFRRYDPAGA